MHYATPRQFVMNIHYDQLSDLAIRSLYRIENGVGAVFMTTWNLHPNDLQLPKRRYANSGQMELKMDFDERDVDIRFRDTDATYRHYENVEAIESLGLIVSNARLAIGQISAAKSVMFGICDVSPSAVVSFNNAPMSYTLRHCWSLAAGDCSENPRYAIFVKKSGKFLKLAVMIYVDEHSLIINPTFDGVEFKIADNVVVVDTDKPFILMDKENATQVLTVAKSAERYLIHVPSLKLTVRYSGDDIVNAVPFTHQSRHCGLCGDYNGQFSRDLVGPTGCIHLNADDLVKAYIMRIKECKDKFEIPACSSETISSPLKKPCKFEYF